MQSKQHEQFDQSKGGRAAVATGNIWDMSICSTREKYRAINPNLNGKRHSDERIRMPQSRTGAAGHGMLETEMETQRDSGGYSGSLLCMKSLTVYHLQDKAQQSRSQTEAVQHTHTHCHTYVCMQASRQAGRQATCGTETEIYADMKTSPMASVKRNIRRQSVVVVARVARKSLSGLLPTGALLAS